MDTETFLPMATYSVINMVYYADKATPPEIIH
jgi:hypothetical protein